MITTEILKLKFRYRTIFWLAFLILAPIAGIAAGTSSIPSVIQAGFALWAKGGPAARKRATIHEGTL